VRDFLLGLRSAFLWTVSVLHFSAGAIVFALLALRMRPQRLDGPLRVFCRNIVRLTGARFEVRRAPGSSPSGSFFYAANHVEIFDPFLVVAATGGTTRGLELESHFRVPIYGHFMRNMGLVPVPDRPTRANLERMKERTAAALAAGVSLVVFPEGTRTRDGHVGRFRPGLFRMAVELGKPIVPVSVVGAFELKRVGRLRLNPARVVVHIHPAVEPGTDPDALCEKIHAIVAGPVEAAWKGPESPAAPLSRRAAPRRPPEPDL